MSTVIKTIFYIALLKVLTHTMRYIPFKLLGLVSLLSSLINAQFTLETRNA